MQECGRGMPRPYELADWNDPPSIIDVILSIHVPFSIKIMITIYLVALRVLRGSNS